ncbi:MAG: TonB-dependent receptor [Deltaproteobacteria bacterium]|nr:TonB-dependent receptor [Candidatus Anaeroferrophillacea bacterium]
MMNKPVSRLSSLRFTTWLLAALCFWFPGFLPLVHRGGGHEVTRIMNHGLVQDWLLHDAGVGDGLKIWFLGLVLLMALLALNLTICTWRRFTPGRGGTHPRIVLMFLIHLTFGLLLLAHGAGFFLGWKPPPVALRAGESIHPGTNPAWNLAVTGIDFRSDPAILTKPRRRWTRHDFDYARNTADIVLERNGSRLLAGRIATYRPLRRGDVQVTLLGFTPPAPGSNSPGVRLLVTRAPCARPVVWLFHALILFTFCYGIATWNPPAAAGSGSQPEKEEIKMKRNRLLTAAWLIVALTLGTALPATAAEDRDSAAGGSVFTLGEVVVTGHDETVTQVSTSETIDIEQLELTNSVTVGEALNILPGIVSTIGTKNEHYFTVRGFNQKYVPIFLDGIPISVPHDGYVDAGVLSTDNLARITVTKGVSSVLYGCNTMGGVINLVSRRPERAFEGDVSLGVREADGWRTAANVGTRQENWYLMLGASYLDQRSFNLPDNFDDDRNEHGDTRTNSSRENFTGSVKVGWTPAEGHEYAIGVNVVEAERDVPPHTFATKPPMRKYWKFTNWDKLTTYLIGDSKLMDGLELKTRLFRDDYDNTLNAYDSADYDTQFARYAFHSVYDDYSWGGSMTLRSEQLKRQKLSLSFHYKEDVHEEQDDYSTPWERYEATTWSLGLEDDIRITDRLSLVLGISYDMQDPEYANGAKVRDDDDTFNPQAGIRFALTDRTVFHASVGRKTRFPTLQELYSSYLDNTVPNPDLEKETAINYELGVDHDLGDHTRLSLALFYSDVEDLIVERYLPDGSDMQDNIGESRFQGIEASIRTTILPRQEIVASYTWLDAEDRSSDRTSDHIEEVSDNKVYISDTVTITDRIRFFAEFQWHDDRWEQDLDGTWNNLDGFVIIDAKVMFDVMDNLDIEAGVQNLFDEEYELSEGYPQAGRTAFAELRYRF